MIGRYFEQVISVLSILLVFFLLSCAQEKKSDTEQYIIDTSEETQIQSEANSLLARDDIQGVLNLYKKSYNRYQTKKTFTDRYVETVETIKSMADKAFESEEFPLAERVYTILLRNFNDFQDFSDSLSFNKAFLNARIMDCTVTIGRKEAQQALNTGKFQKAVDAYRHLRTKYPKNRLTLVDYLKALEDIQSKAEKAFKMSDYVTAWKIYAVLLKNYNYFGGFSQQLPFDRESLHKRIGECRSLLFAKGLDEYRNGNLQNAISAWQSLLVFVPDDKETKRAVDTAILQMKMIQQKR